MNISDEALDMIVQEVNLRDEGYNGAWLNGYRSLAVFLNLVKYDYTTEQYVKA